MAPSRTIIKHQMMNTFWKNGVPLSGRVQRLEKSMTRSTEAALKARDGSTSFSWVDVCHPSVPVHLLWN